MNKYKIIPAALVLVAGAAHAQSSVTLYGLIDEGLTYTSNVGGKSLLALTGGELQQGSRWGLKGQEDLGSGLSAVFLLENGFNLSNGQATQSGQEFGRQAYVGLSSSDAGKVTFGRQYDSVVDYIAPETAAGSWGGTLFAHPYDNDNTSDSFRVNNSVKYTSVNYSGLQFGGLYGFSNQAGGFADNRAWSIGAKYANGPLSIGAAYMNLDNPRGTTAGAVVDSPYIAARQNVGGVAANYMIGTVTLGLAYTHTDISDRPSTFSNTLKFDNIEFNTKVDLTSAIYVGAMYDYTKVAIDFGPGQSQQNNGHSNQFGLMTGYRLSKRTELYLQAAYQKGTGNGVVVALGDGSEQSTSDNQTMVRAGIRTSF